jgi:hypothetical protein
LRQGNFAAGQHEKQIGLLVQEEHMLSMVLDPRAYLPSTQTMAGWSSVNGKPVVGVTVREFHHMVTGDVLPVLQDVAAAAPPDPAHIELARALVQVAADDVWSDGAPHDLRVQTFRADQWHGSYMCTFVAAVDGHEVYSPIK